MIVTLTADSPIKIQECIDVTAVVPVNEDPDLQYEYEWSATGGEIKNSGVWVADSMPLPMTGGKGETQEAEEGNRGRSVTAIASYIAPKTAGVYTITLKVSTRYAVTERSCSVEVMDYIVTSSPRVYWQPSDDDKTLTYRFDVEAIRHSPLLLRYKIQRDFQEKQPATTLIVSIDKKALHTQKIGAGPQHVTDPVFISGEINVTKAINTPRVYTLDFMLQTQDLPENTWLLKTVEIVGVEGAFFP